MTKSQIEISLFSFFLFSFLVVLSNLLQTLCSSPNLPLFFVNLLIFLAFFGVSKVGLIPVSQDSMQCYSFPPSSTSPSFSSETLSPLFLASLSSTLALADEDVPRLSNSVMVSLPAHGMPSNVTMEEKEFWKQPDGAGYKRSLQADVRIVSSLPVHCGNNGFLYNFLHDRSSTYSCSGFQTPLLPDLLGNKMGFLCLLSGLNFGSAQATNTIMNTGSLGFQVPSHQLRQLFETALVVPTLQVNFIWGDESITFSEFSDTFDVEHFKRALQADVRIVPSTHLFARRSVERRILNWIRTRFFRQLNEEGILVLKGLDSKLSKNLPSDQQKLHCKVAFHALIALHLRLEKDVRVRTGCSTCLGPNVNHIIAQERESRPEFLTGRLNMSYEQRKFAGLCPLNALEVARLLKAVGAPGSARLYIAGGEPQGGNQALRPLQKEFPGLVTTELLAKEGELAPYVNRSLSSNVFMPSQGYRAYNGHRKYIKPNKRSMIAYFQDTSISTLNLIPS